MKMLLTAASLVIPNAILITSDGVCCSENQTSIHLCTFSSQSFSKKMLGFMVDFVIHKARVSVVIVYTLIKKRVELFIVHMKYEYSL